MILGIGSLASPTWNGGAWGFYSRASMFGLSLGACMSKWEMDSNYRTLVWRGVGFRMYHALPGGAGFVGNENGFWVDEGFTVYLVCEKLF